MSGEEGLLGVLQIEHFGGIPLLRRRHLLDAPLVREQTTRVVRALVGARRAEGVRVEEVGVARLPEGSCALHVLQVSPLAVRKLLGQRRQSLLQLLADPLPNLVLRLL